MRLGVLDIGSNTVHLLVVDAHPGASPLPAYSHSLTLRLAEHIDADQQLTESGAAALLDAAATIRDRAEDMGCERVLGFATSAVRDAINSAEVLAKFEETSGIRPDVLTGAKEAELTFLAVRRWFGWSSGRITVVDIGGGSLEIATGADERPDVAQSLPLGAGRLSRDWLSNGGPADQATLKELRRHVRAVVARDAGDVLRSGAADHNVATSKTFRSLARICGAEPKEAGPYVHRWLPHDDLRSWIPKLAAMNEAERSRLPGVSERRAHQVVAGAIVADAVMDLYGVQRLEICPWALREGVILDYLDRL